METSVFGAVKRGVRIHVARFRGCAVVPCCFWRGDREIQACTWGKSNRFITYSRGEDPGGWRAGQAAKGSYDQMLCGCTLWCVVLRFVLAE
jgi:hypothetical protein